MKQTDLVSDQEIKLLSELISLQDIEQAMLRKADASQLAEIAERKLGIIERLNVLESTRKTLLNCQDSKEIRAAMDDWLKKHPEDKPTAAKWQKLVGLARQAKQTHDMNRRLVELHLQQTDELLDALTIHPRKNSLYGSDGQAFALSGSRIVDSA